MPPFSRLAQQFAGMAEETATRRDVAQDALKKTAIGKKFASDSFVGQDVQVQNTLRHNPPGAHDVHLTQNTGDSSFRLHNATTGNTMAYFYSTGRAYINLTASAIENTHLGTSSVSEGKLATDSVNRDKVQNTEIILAHLNSDTKTRSQGTPSLREIGLTLGGSSLNAASSNHSHASVNFNSMYTLSEKEHAANLKTAVEAMSGRQQFVQIQPLIGLVLDLAHQLIDDADVDVVEKVRRLKEEPEYAHEFRMRYDDDYFAAWSIDNVPEYAEKAQDDPRIQAKAGRARQAYSKIEDDPGIVQRYKNKQGSLL